MTTADTRERGREAYERQAWAEAYTRLSAADEEAPLGPEDLEHLATAAYLTGRDDESAELLARAHRAFLSRGDVARAARCAFRLATGLMNRGEMARGGGWIARARRLLADDHPDCVEQGYLRGAAAFRCIAEGDYARAAATFGQAAEIGERFGDPDLVATARHGRGRALIRMGNVHDGVALLDEAMAAVEAGEVSPVVVGEIYCGVISGCLEVFDLRRAQEWTAALTHWCDAQPDLVPYSGDCLVRRAEIMLLHGAWGEAGETAQRACERCLQASGQAAAGAAVYQQAELHRLRGAFAEAEEAYRQASRWGRKPQPGLALLRLAQGQVEAASAAIRRAVGEAEERRTQSKLLPAYVEILLAAEDVAAARTAADELTEIAAGLGAPFLQAASAHATGAVLLAEGDARAGLGALREAWTTWQGLDAPYEAARARVLLGLACRQLGDDDTAALELDAARWAFRELGAAPDLARVEALSRKAPPAAPGGLTPRELEVLRLVATGKTNRAVADALFISEKTVARHVSNILGKLGVPTRAAATAYAYEHGLL